MWHFDAKTARNPLAVRDDSVRPLILLSTHGSRNYAANAYPPASMRHLSLIIDTFLT